MSDFSELSDFEINKRVAELWQMEKGGEVKQCLHYNDDAEKYYPDKTKVTVYTNLGEKGGSYDYCNNPEDAWPIILGNGISINMVFSYCYKDEFEANFTKRPLRAAMIVYLMMKEGEHE